ncbi:hypothetical protein HXX76_003989 [Chlamydomonas incerta]|uniref:protein-tyrosine-phosphatase n=1 Tax=Chlamydomonas incerta TaxID=51695 RepID=A0A835TCI6_CHLIN|nr:hypothetical protein HXX76_003989 [Chlamydomonas incerta]|eukprot:KAG2441137.1 hypothetical protein HXX76_003989 [Chlamydomonas incerta]
MEPPSEILPGCLWLGGLSSLKYLEELGITHVLSVVNFPIQRDLSGYTTLQLPLQDSEASNMLQYLPAAIKFLDAALGPGSSSCSTTTAAATGSPEQQQQQQAAGGGGGRVLVHCQAGMSRSPAILAGWLMRSRGLELDEAMRLIRSKRPFAEPNEGFAAQLTLFGDMRCSLDAAHPVYRMWVLEELGGRWEDEGWVDPDSFPQLPEPAAALAAGHSCYRCRKCRQLLATSAHVMPIEAAMGHRVFRDRQRHRATALGTPPGGEAGGGESCLFTEPLAWMAGVVTGVNSGKLHCPKCAARLGSFNWSGISNPQGAWVTPAFQLHMSKIDTISPQPLEALAHVSRPLVLPARDPAAAAAAAATTAASSSAAATSSTPAAGAPTAEAPTVAAGAGAGAAAVPTLPADLPAQLRRMGLGTAGPGQEDEEQLPEPRLDLDLDLGVEAAAEAGAAAVTAAVDSDRAGSGAAASTTTSAPATSTTGPATAASTTAAPATSPSASTSAPSSAWFSHLILDCDGVMVDSEAASCEALRRAILEVTGFDIPHTFPGDYTEVFGMDVRSCVGHYRAKFGRSDWESPEALAPRVQAAKELHYRELTAGGIRAFDGAEALLRRAVAAGMKVGVASSGAPDKIARNLASSGLAALIPPGAAVSAAAVAAGKPAPDVYLEAMRVTGCTDPWRALVVEDAVNGLMAARSAGMFAIGITNQLPAAVLAPWAHRVVSHLDEVDPAGLAPGPDDTPGVPAGLGPAAAAAGEPAGVGPAAAGGAGETKP